MKRTFMFAMLAGPAMAACVASAAEPKPRNLSDTELLRMDSSPFDKKAMMFKSVVLGRHKGTLVVADFPCGDVCPAATRRIIHYQVEASNCAGVGGVVVQEFVPRGPAVARKAFCKPPVLANTKR